MSDTLPSRGLDARIRAEVDPFADLVTLEMPSDIEWCFTGPWRRHAPTMTSLDVAIVTPTGTLGDLELPTSVRVTRRGERIARGDLTIDDEILPVDFWVCSPRERGAFLMFTTGPADLWRAQRKRAELLNLTLHPVGLMLGTQQVDDGTEEHIYDLLGMTWLPPEARQAFVPPELVERRVLSSKKDQYYTVKVKGPQASCTCLGFLHRGYCKHVLSLRKELGIVGALVTANMGL